MPIEYEYFFTNFDKEKIIKSIKQNNGQYIGTYLFRVQVYECNNCYLRVRDEGHKITITHKRKDTNSNFDEENEVIIDNFDNGIRLLNALGFQKKYYYEKIREIWKCDKCEIIFDTIPGIYDTMEIECATKIRLNKMTNLLKLIPYSNEMRSNLHLHLFGIDLNKKIGDNTFSNLKKVLLPLVTKNKKEFNKLIKEQKTKYTLLIGR